MVSKHTSTLKRCFDLAAAATGLVAGSPVILATAAAMAVATRSFPLFRQERVGKDGKPFIILKIKTMNDKCDADGNLLPEDQRTSTLGVIVRKTHFDEIPQLLNILRGDMSVVGPRPFCDNVWIAKDALRCSVKPGLTGPAQISGNNSLTIEEVLECDQQYVEQMAKAPALKTVLQDLKIVAATPLSIVNHLKAPHYRPVK